MKNAARACAISTIAQYVTLSLSAQILSAASSTPEINTFRSPKRNSKVSKQRRAIVSIFKEFILLASVDPVYFENTHYLGPDKGGEKPYRLLADAMAKSGRVAIAELVSRGKEQLVLIRPYRKGLVMHTMYYGNEVRDFKQVPKGENVKISETELDLGVGLIERLTSEEFKPENYKDEYRIRVLGMLDEKSKGKEIVIDKAPEPKHGQVIDIMEALKRSMERVPAKRKPATRAAAKKKTVS